jgi:prepilin-type processing-associated H-X9-DG protein
MNAALGGKRVSELQSPQSAPLFFDSGNLAADASGDVGIAPIPGRHMGRNNVVFADGNTGVLGAAPKG